MRKGLLLLGMAVVASSSQAAILLNGTYTNNFDALRNSGSLSGAFSATIGVQQDIENLLGEWQGGKIAGTGGSATAFVADAGTGTAGTLYSYGSSGSAERALGSVASGGAALGFGAVVTNSGSQAISSVTIQVRQENWRSSSGNNVNVLTFGWGLVGGSVTASNYLTDSGASTDVALDLTGVAATTAASLDGNTNFVNKSTTLTFSTPIAVGDSFYIRWSDVDNTGSDAGIAIDNIEITATPVPEPATMAILGLGVASLIRRRRK